MKRCNKCNQDKELSEFHKHKLMPDGHVGRCKTCKKTYSQNYYNKNREKIIKSCRQYAVDHPEWAKAKGRRHKRKKVCGITQSDYDTMYMTQLGLCAVCHDPFGVQTPCVDHCHKTGKVRGIVHNKCNRIMGQAQDDISKLQYAIEYLQKFS